MNELNREIQILNQLIAAQSKLHTFPTSEKMAEFTVRVFKNIPGIDQCCICMRDSKVIIGDNFPESYKIQKTLSEFSFNENHISMPVSEVENQVVLTLKSTNRLFGYIIIKINNNLLFEPFKSASYNFSNIIAIHLENSWQKELLISQQETLEETVAKRTAELLSEIEDRKKTDESLQKSELRLLSHDINSPLANIEWDANYIVTRWTGSAEKIFGWKAEETLGKPIFDLNMIYEEDIPIVEKTMEKLNSGESLQVVSANRNYTKNGKIIYCEWYNSVLLDEKGKMASVLSRVLDVTERKNIELSLSESEEKYRLLHEAAGVGIGYYSTEGVVISFNSIAAQNMNGKPEDFVGKSVFELFPKEAADFYLGRIKKAAESETPEEYEDKVVLPTGVRWFNSVFTRITDSNKKIAGIQIISTDITERKNQQENFARNSKLLNDVMDYSSALIYILDTQGKFISINRQLEIVFGIPKEEIIGKTRNELMLLDVAKQHFINDQEVIKARSPITFEEENLETDGLHFYLTTKFPLFDHQNNLYGIAGISTDITENKRAENLLVESESKYRELFENMNTGFVLFEVVHDEKGKPADLIIVAANKEFENSTGLDLKQVTGKRLTIELPGIENDAADWIGTFGEIALNGGSKQFENCSEILGKYFNVYAYQFAPNKCAVSFLDTTDRKRAEEERQKFVMLADGSSEFIGMCDLDLKPFYVNPAGMKMVGLTDLEAACQVKVQDYFFPEDQKFIGEEFFPRVLKDGHGEVEIRLRHFQTGKPIWMSYYLFHLRDTNGKLIGWATVSRDITERKQAENQIRTSEERFSKIFHASPFPINLFRFSDGRSVDVNNAYLNLTGYSREEFLNNTSAELNLFVNPNDRKVWMDEIAEFGSANQHEIKLRQKSGTIIDVVGTIELIEVEGEKYGLAMAIDVTDKKRAEDELRASEEKFKAVAEVSPLAIYSSSGEDQKAQFMNPTFHKMFGYTWEDVPTVGNWWIKAFPDENYRKHVMTDWQNEIDLANKNQTDVKPYECVCTCKDGTEKIIAWSAKNVGDEFYAFGQDLTERVQSEEALKESEERLRLSTELANVAVWEFDFIANSMTRSKNHDQLYGLEFQDKWEFETFLNATHPDDREYSNEMIQKSAAPGGPDKYKFDFRVVYPDQTTHWLMVTGQVSERNKKGEALIVRGTLIDITERKQAVAQLMESESNLISLINNTQDSIWSLDTNYRYIIFNKTYADIFFNQYGFEVKKGMDAKKQLSHEELPFWESMFDAVFAGEKKVFEFNHLIDGTLRYFQTSINPIYEDNKITGASAMSIDITNIKHAEKEIQKLNEDLEKRVTLRTDELTNSQAALMNLVEDLNEKSLQLEKSKIMLETKNKELETFSYSVSHDLKAPLRGIDGYSRLLQELYSDQLNDEGKKFVETIRTGTKQMNQLIEDLLAYSRLERTILRSGPVNIKEIVGNILLLLKDDISNNKIKIIQEIDAYKINADHDGMTIVIRNIIENAIKFSAKNEMPEIKIIAKENVSSWQLSISDNGIGFDMKYHNRIFEIFQRLNLSEQFPGTGIGLAMVYKSMERMGGKVWAESSPGKGATFYLEITKD